DKASLGETLTERCQIVRRHPGRPAVENPDHRHRRLLRPCRERPGGRRTAEQRDEVAPVAHSITSSARPSSVGGMVRPIALAVVKLMASSNLVGCSTEISPGFAPRKILSTNSAARRNWASMLGPYDTRPPASINSRAR